MKKIWEYKTTEGREFLITADYCEISKAGDLMFLNKETKGRSIILAIASGRWEEVELAKDNNDD